MRTMKMSRVNISALTKSELDQVIAHANFTDDQLAIFNELNKNKFYDYAIMTNLNIPNRRYYNTKSIVVDKVERIAVEMGYTHAIKPTYKC
jgi:hypothetical protein